jgi:hypothetical protein
VSGGRLLFGYDHDDRMYKLGLIDTAGLESGSGPEGEGVGPEGGPVLSALFTERDFSGAVALPVLAGDALYYRGSFFNTDRLMRYPEPLGALSGRAAGLHLVPWDRAALEEAGAAATAAMAVGGTAGAPGRPPSGPASGAAMEGEVSVADQGAGASVAGEAAGLPLPGAPPGTPDPAPSAASPSAASPSAPSPGPAPLPSTVYLPFKYLNPLHLWLPIPLFRTDPDALLGFSVDGGGILSVMIDPPELNTIVLQAAMDARFSMLHCNVEWTNSNLGFPLVLKFSDDVSLDTVNYRAIRVGSEFTLTHSLGSQGVQGFLGAGFNGSRFYTQKAGDSQAAYTWDFLYNSYKFMARLGASSLIVMPWETFGQGFMVQTIGWFLSTDNQALPQDFSPRIDALVQAAFEPLVPCRLTLYGAWDDYQAGMNLQGASSQYPSPVFQSVAAVEYQSQDIGGLKWIAGGEAELRLFSLNIQRSFSHLYINRLLGTLAYRAALYDAVGFSKPEGNSLGGDLRLTQSLVFRLGSGISSVLVTSVPYRITAYLQTALKLSRFGGDSAGFTDVVAVTPYIGIRF